MQGYTERIQEAARRLLVDKQVDVVIGFRKGTVPLMNEPFLAKNVDQVRQLYWDGNCGINLANYLPKRTDRIGIVAKGCDSRNIVVHLLEYQIKREQLYILGAPCHGMIDRRRILASLDGRDPSSAEEKDGVIKVVGSDFMTNCLRSRSRSSRMSTVTPMCARWRRCPPSSDGSILKI